MTSDADLFLDELDRGAVRGAVEAVAALPDEAIGDPASVTRAIVRAWGRVGTGDAPGAIAALRPLVATLEAGDDRRRRAHALLALGVACVLGGEADSGTALLERALSLHAEAWPRAQCLRFLALALEQRGAWEGAAARYVAAAETYRAIDHDYGVGSALYGAATALAELGEDAAAHARLTEAVEALRRAGSNAALGAALGLLATLEAETDGARALAILDEAEALADATPAYRTDATVRRAEILLALGRAGEALGHARGAREVLAVGSAERAWVDHLVARGWIGLGHDAEAAELLDPAGDTALSGPALLERHALRLVIAARAADGPRCDRALDGLDRAVRARWRRRGVAGHVAAAAEGLVDREPERAARALHAAVALGAPIDPLAPTLRGLRARGARIPLGPLWLEAPLGRGGMGEVWRARHRDGGEVAVKILRADGTGEHAALFEAEVQAIARLDHPNVVRVLAALTVDPAAARMLERRAGSAALVMELVPGGSLDARLSGWRWPEARALLGDLLDALAHAHARGVLHLDLKPANVLVDDTGGGALPRLTDFGLAGLARRDDVTGAMFGTPAYMAPEQARVGAPLGPTTDLYAFGCLAWHLLSGQTVHATKDPEEQLERHRLGLLPRFAAAMPVPGDVEGWLRTLLARRPEHRFACAADARWALDALGEATGPAAGPRSPAPRPDATTFDLRTLAAPFAPPAARGSTAPSADRPDRRPSPPPRAPSARPVAPLRPDWRSASKRRPMPFLAGAGEGLFAWRVGRLVGREPERDRLWAALAEVHARREGRAVWILGADGLGRTALLRWLAETAHATGAARVYEARADGLGTLEAAVRRGPADRPALVIVDDAESAAATDLVHALADTALVVAAARALPSDAGDAETIRLSPLSEAELAALVDDRLPLDRALATRLAARAAGSPAFAVALLTDLVRRDALEPGPEGFRERDALLLTLPEDLRGLWTARLDALAPAGTPRRAAWEIAAVLGVTLDFDAWARACERVGLLPDEGALAPLEREGWVERVGGRIRFRVPVLREALAAGAELSGRALAWHGAAADVLADRPDDAAAFARHLAAAGRHTEALRPLRRAAADAVNATRLEECRALVEQWDRSADALGLAPDDPRRASPLVVRVHLALHTREDPFPLLDRGLRLVTGREPEAECQLTYTLGWVLAREGRHAEAEPVYVRAIALARMSGLDEMVAVAQIGLAASVFALGRDATPLVEHTRSLTRGLDHLVFRSDACAGRGLARLGRPDQARALLLHAIEGARRGEAPDVEAEALADLADLATAAGDLRGAIASMEGAVAALASTSSDKALGAGVRLAALLVCGGRDDDARAALAPIRQRFAWRLRPAVAAEMALVGLALDGGDLVAEAAARAALGPAAESPAVRRLLAVLAERRARR